MTGIGFAAAPAPHVFKVRSSARTMWIMSACLFAPVVQSALSDGFSSLLIAATAVASAMACELAVELASGARVREPAGRALGIDGSVVVSALVLALMMPNRIHPVVPAVGAAFAVLVVKNSFGGLGSNWLNPAAGAWLFLRFSWSPLFDQALSQSPTGLLASSVSKGLVDSSGSPMALLKVAGWKPSLADERLTSWLNDSVLSSFGAVLPSGYIDLFAAPGPALIVERGYFMLVCASVVLIALRLVKWQLPFAYILCYLAASRLWGGLPYGGALFSGDMVFALFSGILALSSYVLVADPGTGCKTVRANVLLAAVAGLVSFFLNYASGDPYGVLLAVPFVNLLAVLLRMLERRVYFMPGGRS